MSTARYGKKWADVDEEDEDEEAEDQNTGGGTRFETQADKDGIKTVIEYLERDGKTYKVTKKGETDNCEKLDEQKYDGQEKHA